MKKILFIGAGPFQTDGIIRANELGFHTIAFDGNPNAYGKDYAKEFYHIDICDKEAVLEKAKVLEIDAVLAIAAEVSLESTAYVAQQLGLPGYKPQHIEISHNKDKYYSLFKKNGINVPVTYIYEGKATLNKLDVNKKYIIKPSQGSGSRGVKIIDDVNSFDIPFYIEKYLKKGEIALIQEFIKGKEMTIDGFVSNKTFHLLSISQESNDEEKGHTFSSELVFPPLWMTIDIKEKLWIICDKIVKALDLDVDGPMHLEVLKTESNDFYVIDFSLRGGGFDLFTKIDKLVTGIDPLQLYIMSTIGEPIHNVPKISDDHNFVVLNFIYPEKSGCIVSIKGIELEGMHTDYYFKTMYRVGEFVSNPESGSQRLGYLICWSNDREQMMNRQQEILSQISFTID